MFNSSRSPVNEYVSSSLSTSKKTSLRSARSTCCKSSLIRLSTISLPSTTIGASLIWLIVRTNTSSTVTPPASSARIVMSMPFGNATSSFGSKNRIPVSSSTSIFNSSGGSTGVYTSTSPSRSKKTSSRSTISTLPGSSSTVTSAMALATSGGSLTGVITSVNMKSVEPSWSSEAVSVISAPPARLKFKSASNESTFSSSRTM